MRLLLIGNASARGLALHIRPAERAGGGKFDYLVNTNVILPNARAAFGSFGLFLLGLRLQQER